MTAERERTAGGRSKVSGGRRLVGGLDAVVGSGVLGAPASARATAGSVDATRNVILMIPDGSSRVHDTAARHYRAYDDDPAAFPTNVRNTELAVDRADHVGAVTTHPDDPVESTTDSAAAATAVSTGRKTHNGAVAVDADGRPMSTVLERARDAGYATGLVTTAELTHATPASFAAHVADRDDAESIARQYVTESGVDVLLGGDRSRFRAADRADGTDLLGEAAARGYRYVETAEELRAVENGRVLGLFTESGHLDFYLDRAHGNDPAPADRGALDGGATGRVAAQIGATDGSVADQPMLETMTRKAVDLLERRSERGFFLLVEGARIDHAGHLNSFAAVPEQLEYDDTLGAVLDYARTGDDETLVVSAADHDCGGLGFGVDDRYGMDWAAVVERERSRAFDPTETRRINREAGLSWETTGHTGRDVPVYAAGPNAEFFAGYGDNTDLLAGLEAHLGLAGPATSAGGRRRR
jgi:alkaline phosphatase